MLSQVGMLLTGVSGGIGSAIYKFFLGRVKFIVTSSRHLGTDLFAGDDPSHNVEHIPRDLTEEGQVRGLFREVLAKHGRVDLLINCVGGSLFSHRIEEFPMDQFDQVLTVNLRSAFLLTREAILVMKKNGAAGGRIIHFVSSAATRVSQNKAPYGVAKAGLAHLIHYAAVEAGEYNILVNGISPTYVFTPRHEREIEQKSLQRGIPREKIAQEMTSGQIISRGMVPQDLLALVELLATTTAITGQVIACDMGESVG